MSPRSQAILICYQIVEQGNTPELLEQVHEKEGPFSAGQKSH